ncbi:hypothetical protein LCGC14_0770530 [marine sediment metagenome]|uniref:Recombination endonuclease VII n=1 Tax=marine sediment metagenome TaxID=412755 RepID=A0A0F9QI70_9ZZZZ
MGYKDRDWLFDQYWNQKKSMREIAKECSVNHYIISKWLVFFNISKRTNSETQKIAVKKRNKPKLIKNKKELRNRFLLRTYGIRIEEYEELLQSQNNKCAICGILVKRGRRKKNFAVDHNHETGEVRGLLCEDCNRGIGLLREDIGILQKAIKYLESFED